MPDAHEVRLGVAERTLPASKTASLLRLVAESYVSWAVENHEHWTRIGWRLAALIDIGRNAGLEMETEWWNDLRARFEQEMILMLKRSPQTRPVPSGMADDPPR